MRESVELVELVSLEKVGRDCWRFQVKFNASFDAVFESLKKAHAFNAATSYRWDEKKEHHLVNDQGIWLLSHCFSNWDEMFAQATKKSPWEEAWQKKAEQGEPEQKKDIPRGQCAECGVGWFFTPYAPCSDCGKPICGRCKVPHVKNHQYARKCSECGKSFGEIFAPIYTCTRCFKDICVFCEKEHQEKHHQEAEAKKKQEAYTVYRCSGCNKLSMPQDPKDGSPYWQCPTCHDYFCETCCYRHTHTQEYAYSARTEYGMPGGINFDDLNTIFEAYNRARHSGQEQAKAEQERKRKEEEAERIRKEQEKWFWGATSSTDLESAFNVLNLSTRATVQEVKRAFRRKAKEAHPDTGGSEQAFKALNAAYQLALAHAERNEVK